MAIRVVTKCLDSNDQFLWHYIQRANRKLRVRCIDGESCITPDMVNTDGNDAGLATQYKPTVGNRVEGWDKTL